MSSARQAERLAIVHGFAGVRARALDAVRDGVQMRGRVWHCPAIRPGARRPQWPPGPLRRNWALRIHPASRRFNVVQVAAVDRAARPSNCCFSTAVRSDRPSSETHGHYTVARKSVNDAAALRRRQREPILGNKTTTLRRRLGIQAAFLKPSERRQLARPVLSEVDFMRFRQSCGIESKSRHVGSWRSRCTARSLVSRLTYPQ